MRNITKTKFSCQRGGLTIRGYEYRPEGEKLPIAIVSHGFMANLIYKFKRPSTIIQVICKALVPKWSEGVFRKSNSVTH